MRDPIGGCKERQHRTMPREIPSPLRKAAGRKITKTICDSRVLAAKDQSALQRTANAHDSSDGTDASAFPCDHGIKMNIASRQRIGKKDLCAPTNKCASFFAPNTDCNACRMFVIGCIVSFFVFFDPNPMPTVYIIFCANTTVMRHARMCGDRMGIIAFCLRIIRMQTQKGTQKGEL